MRNLLFTALILFGFLNSNALAQDSSLKETRICSVLQYQKDQKSFDKSKKEQTNLQKKISSPSEEEFEPADGLIGARFKVGLYQADWEAPRSSIKIYNADGSLWYEFSYNEDSTLFYYKNLNPDLKPYYAIKTQPLYFRIKAVSENWYEVTVNEEKQLTKFIPKNAPETAPDSLGKYVLFSPYILSDKDNNPLREEPDGAIINKAITNQERLRPLCIQGDWVFVKVLNTEQRGWIRWKKDRDILIKYNLNVYYK